MTIYCRCLSGKKEKKPDKTEKKIDLNLHASMFLCCLTSYQPDIDSTVDLVEAVILRTRRHAWLQKRREAECRSVVCACSCRLRAV